MGSSGLRRKIDDDRRNGWVAWVDDDQRHRRQKIVKFSAATKTVAKNGTHVFVIGAKNGSNIEANTVVVGENGLFPPM